MRYFVIYGKNHQNLRKMPQNRHLTGNCGSVKLCYRGLCDIDELSHTRVICFLRVWFNIHIFPSCSALCTLLTELFDVGTQNLLKGTTSTIWRYVMWHHDIIWCILQEYWEGGHNTMSWRPSKLWCFHIVICILTYYVSVCNLWSRNYNWLTYEY